MVPGIPLYSAGRQPAGNGPDGAEYFHRLAVHRLLARGKLELYSLGAARWQVFGKVVVPAVLPWMLGSLRINISLALAGAIVGEFIASGHGLGRMVIYAGTILDTTLVWVGVIVLSLLAMVMYFAVVELEKWMTEHLAIYRKA